jgi:hypothetical protein
VFGAEMNDGVDAESANGLASSRSGTSYRADEACAHLPTGQQTHYREQDYAACVRQLETLVIAKGMCLPILLIYPPIPSLFCRRC